MAIHISASMKRCHGSWRPLTAHLNFNAVAKFAGTILCPSLFESYHSFFKDVFQSRCDVPFHMTVISNQTRFPSVISLVSVLFLSVGIVGSDIFLFLE